MPPTVKKPLAAQVSPVNLPPFMEDKPAVWFTLAEGQFKMKGIQDKCHWFYTVLAVLSVQQPDTILDIAEQSPIQVGAYQQVKERLLQLQDLDVNQRVDCLLDMPALQGQKLPEMLAKMRQLCPMERIRPPFSRECSSKDYPKKSSLCLPRTTPAPSPS